MKTLQEQIIEKQDEYITYLKRLCGIKSVSSDKYESELSVLKAQAEQEPEEKRYATLGGGVSDGSSYPGELNYKGKELFEKVYIRSEADNPKKDGNYICHHVGARENELDVLDRKSTRLNSSHRL